MNHPLDCIDDKINAFFDFDFPCFFEDCENLRLQFNMRLEEGICQGCHRGDLIREFIPKIKKCF